MDDAHLGATSGRERSGDEGAIGGVARSVGVTQDGGEEKVLHVDDDKGCFCGVDGDWGRGGFERQTG